MENWKDIPNHPNHQVSDLGNVRNKKSNRILKPFPDRYGYLRLSLGSEDNVYVHKLVCSAFHEKPLGKEQINHIDCDRQNNNANNLEWCTSKENIKWGVDHGKIDPSIGLKAAIEKNRKPVRFVENGQEFNSVKECADFLNVKSTNVCKHLTGCRKGRAIHGFHVEYVNE